MAKLGDMTVHVRMRMDISLWDAFKLRLSGAGMAMKQWIEVEIEERDAVERDHPIT
jgi:hypothetical protein